MGRDTIRVGSCNGHEPSEVAGTWEKTREGARYAEGKLTETV